jgi:hypothetical protein
MPGTSGNGKPISRPAAALHKPMPFGTPVQPARQPAGVPSRLFNQGQLVSPRINAPPPRFAMPANPTVKPGPGVMQPMRPPVAMPPALPGRSSQGVHARNQVQPVLIPGAPPAMVPGRPEVAQLRANSSYVIQCACGACGAHNHAQAGCTATQQAKNAYRQARMQNKHGGGNAHGRRANIPAARAKRQNARARAQVARRAAGKK